MVVGRPPLAHGDHVYGSHRRHRTCDLPANSTSERRRPMRNVRWRPHHRDTAMNNRNKHSLESFCIVNVKLNIIEQRLRTWHEISLVLSNGLRSSMTRASCTVDTSLSTPFRTHFCFISRNSCDSGNTSMRSSAFGLKRWKNDSIILTFSRPSSSKPTKIIGLPRYSFCGTGATISKIRLKTASKSVSPIAFGGHGKRWLCSEWSLASNA